MTWERFTGLSSFLKGIALLRAISTGSVIPRRSASGVGKKRGIWARRKAWFDCHQREDESVSQWWDRKVEISKDCNLKKMTTDEICLLQFMLGIQKKEKKLKEEMLRIKEPKLDDLLVLARNWE